MSRITPGTIFAERYQILECLGRGGMGTVYSAQHTALAKKFAIKILHNNLSVNKSALKRFAQEARAASGIEHQNIIDVVDAGIIEETAFYVMEHLKGEDLQTMFARDCPLSWDRVQRIMLQICDALQAAHDRRIVHRDLKPSNFYRITRGSNSDFIKVLDFGIAKVRAPDEKTRDGLTAVGSILGTLKYMAPEQAMGKKIDHRADIYSAGVIMYHALTGELPFKGSQPAELIHKLLSEQPPPPSSLVESLPPEVELLVLKALSKDPSDRFPSMRSLASAIERIKPGETPRPRKVTQARSPIIELDESSVYFVSQNNLGESVADVTTLVRAPRLPQPEILHPSPSRPLIRHDDIVTQTSSPKTLQARRRGSAATWVIAGCAATLVLIQLQQAYVATATGSKEFPSQQQVQQSPSPAAPSSEVPSVSTASINKPALQDQPIITDRAAVEVPPKSLETETPSTPAIQTPGPGPRKPPSNPVKKPKSTSPDPGGELCVQYRSDVDDARAAGNSRLMLKILSANAGCWKGYADEAVKLRVYAHKELQQWADCISSGSGKKDPEIQKWVKLCMSRASELPS